MGRKIDRYFIPAVIGLAPFLLLLLTWAPAGRTPLQRLTLSLYLPIVASELFVILVAVREGMLASMKRWSWPRLPTAALLVWMAIAVGTAVTAPNAADGRLSTFYWLLHLGFGFSVAYLCGKQFERIDLVTAYLGGFALFLLGLVLFAASVRDPQFNWTGGWPAAGHVRHLGYYIAAMVALCVGLTATRPGSLKLAGLFGLSAAGLAIALWTGSRGTIVGVVGGVAAGIVLIPHMRRPLAWGGAAASLAVGAALAAVFPAPASNMGLARTVTATVEKEVTTGRTAMWQNALDAIRQRPVFGYGENQMSTVAPFYGLIQPHDVILQVLLAWGAVGLVCLVIAGIWFLRRALPSIRNDAGVAAPFMVMLALASFALIDGSLFHVVPVSIFAACAGMVASSWRERAVRDQ